MTTLLGGIAFSLLVRNICEAVFATWLLLALGATFVAGFSNSNQRIAGLAETHLIASVNQLQLVVLVAILGYFSYLFFSVC